MLLERGSGEWLEVHILFRQWAHLFVRDGYEPTRGGVGLCSGKALLAPGASKLACGAKDVGEDEAQLAHPHNRGPVTNWKWPHP